MRFGRAGALLLLALPVACGDTPAGQALRRVQPAPAVVQVQGPALVLLAPRRAVLQQVSGAGPRRLWRGIEANVAIGTEGARLVATAGFRQIVMATRFEGPDPLDDPRALVGREAFARRSVDLAGEDRDPAGMRFGVALECALRGREEAEWIVVEERCTGGVAAFTNRFWVDPQAATVVRSEQWAGDETGPLTVEYRGG
jgi:hypothetical protein